MMIDTGPAFYSAVPTALAHSFKFKVKNLETLYQSFLRAHIFQTI